MRTVTLRRRVIYPLTLYQNATKRLNVFLIILTVLSLCLVSCDIFGPAKNKPPEQPQPRGLKPDHIDAPVTARLCWTCEDRDNDELKYDVYFGAHPIPSLIGKRIDKPYLNLPRLQYGKTFYWRVVAYDDHGHDSHSPLWRFTTIEENGVIHFPDSAFEKYIRIMINKPEGEITTADATRDFPLHAWNIESFEGVEHFENISQIILENTIPPDISPIALLPSVEIVSAYNFNQLLLFPIRNLSTVKILKYRYIQLDFIHYLTFYDDLRELFFYWCPISDTDPIGKLTNLTKLRMNKTWIDDISFISNLFNLESLEFNRNSITDIEPLSDLKNLRALDISQNDINDISPLQNLKNLKHFYANVNKISDISALKNLINLQIVALESNNISDIRPLVDNPGMGPGHYIYLRNNPLSDISINTYIPELQQRNVYVLY